jgi:hypothetical protein
VLPQIQWRRDELQVSEGLNQIPGAYVTRELRIDDP